jgi:hypothetical protein
MMDVDRVGSSSAQMSPSAALVRATLARMIASQALHLSDRNKQFLGYVVEETLCGRSSRIKAYVIGVDVFGRGEDFDPNSDPIVRIEATRVRSALADYYAAARHEDIRITMKPGSYVPSFEWSAGSAADGPDEAEAGETRTALRSVALLCRDRAQAEPAGDREAMLVHAVASRLAASGSRIYLPDVRAMAGPAARPCDVALEIAVWDMVGGHRYTLTLTDPQTREFLWSMTLDRDESGPPCAPEIDAVAAKAARCLIPLMCR